ncbi:MAG: NADPH-dependent glutamate synthase [Actinobacteria bacterium]|nr:NADPH-dependent glutamate synthase [Actinomycetota bacterium]
MASEKSNKKTKKVKIPRTSMPEQNPEERIKNFNEVALGYTEEDAIKESARCLQCKNPRCIEGCPVDIDIKSFIDLISKKEFDKALDKIREKNFLPAICGRVCPQEDQCEEKCILAVKEKPVAIGRLERFVADRKLSKNSITGNESNGCRENNNSKSKELDCKSSNKKIAIIGSGPAGLTCAGELAKKGYKVTIFEALHKTGGVLVYGIPEFRLPKKILEKEVKFVESLGVETKLNMVIGKILTIDDMLNNGYSSVFIATGAGLPYFMNIPGENLNGVYSANEYLTRSNLMKAYLFPEYDTPIVRVRDIAVVGGGNVAMDSARTAKRLGAKNVYLIYRRSEVEMPARNEEIEHAKQEGIEFILLTNPVEIVGSEGWVKKIKCVKMKLCEPDESGRRRPMPVVGSEYNIDIEAVVMAIGQGPNPLLTSTASGLKLTRRGNIEADIQTGKTSKKGVFAGGDIVTGAATVILAMGAGKNAAGAIDKYIKTGIW